MRAAECAECRREKKLLRRTQYGGRQVNSFACSHSSQAHTRIHLLFDAETNHMDSTHTHGRTVTSITESQFSLVFYWFLFAKSYLGARMCEWTSSSAAAAMMVMATTFVESATLEGEMIVFTKFTPSRCVPNVHVYAGARMNWNLFRQQCESNRSCMQNAIPYRPFEIDKRNQIELNVVCETNSNVRCDPRLWRQSDRAYTKNQIWNQIFHSNTHTPSECGHQSFKRDSDFIIVYSTTQRRFLIRNKFKSNRRRGSSSPNVYTTNLSFYSFSLSLSSRQLINKTKSKQISILKSSSHGRCYKWRTHVVTPSIFDRRNTQAHRVRRHLFKLLVLHIYFCLFRLFFKFYFYSNSVELPAPHHRFSPFDLGRRFEFILLFCFALRFDECFFAYLVGHRSVGGPKQFPKKFIIDDLAQRSLAAIAFVCLCEFFAAPRFTTFRIKITQTHTDGGAGCAHSELDTTKYCVVLPHHKQTQECYEPTNSKT